MSEVSCPYCQTINMIIWPIPNGPDDFEEAYKCMDCFAVLHTDDL